MCTVLLPTGVNPIAVNKYIIYHKSFLFAYRHCDLDGSYSNVTKTRHVNPVVAARSWEVARSGEAWTEGGFTLALFQGCGVGSEML
jgi:hypothetical protein